MKFTRALVPDIIICEPNIVEDTRGYFLETFRQDKLEAFVGYKINFCQDNESKSTYGVLRGLHYQKAPFAQTKLVRVIEGKVLDVIVDIRKDSKTFGQHVSFILTGENKKQVLIPKGFAHGFVVLSEKAVLAYKVDCYYNADSDKGIAYNDSFLDIDWKLPPEDLKLSKKDTKHPIFNEAEYF